MSDSLTRIRDSAPDDLRALASASRAGRPDDRISADEIFVAPSFHGGGLPIVSFDTAPTTSRWRVRGAIVVATLALSAVALAAVPAMLAPRDDARARPDARAAIGAHAARGSAEHAIAERAIAERAIATSRAAEVAVTDPADLASATAERLVASTERAVRRRPPADPSHTASTPPAIRHDPLPSRDATSSAAVATAMDPALATTVDSALAGIRPAAVVEPLPASPSSRDVSAVLRALERQVASCREGDGGMVAARVVIDGRTGLTQSVQVSGAEGGEGACVARAVERARFPRFAQDRFVVTFPYRI